MGNYRPWGPHGAEGSPLEVTPNPTAQGSFQNIGGADWDASPVAISSGAAGPTHPVSQIAFSLIMVPFVWLFWICLYPMTAAAGIVSGLAVSSVASRFLARGDVDVANFFGVVVGFAVILVVCRIEYRLAQNAGFRTGRHIVRLIMFGVFGVPWFMGFMGDADARRASFSYMFKMLGSPSFLLQQILSNLIIIVIVAVAMHFVLTKAERLRGFWHRRLRWIGLK